jgi:dihydropteroate synthase
MSTVNSKKYLVKLRNQVVDLNSKTWIMGILNITPDSFSDGGNFSEINAALLQAEKMVADGADIIDVGGESTRPGHVPVSEEEELRRVIPIIKALREKLDTPISIDTYKAEVAKQAVAAGADIINDIWGAKKDPNMAKVAAEAGVPIILMHNRENLDYQDFLPDVIKEIQESVELVKKAGVNDGNIILDPGIGFAKTHEQNLQLLREMDKFCSLGYPVLLGTSRKRVVGLTLDLPTDQRVEGTGATCCLGIERGCQIMRVHDVLEISRMARMMDAMLGKGKGNG